MKNSKRIAFTVAITLLSSLTLTLISHPIQAQVPTKPELEVDGTNIDDLPNDPQQLRTWVCRSPQKAIAVEVQEISGWKDVIEGKEWNCEEEVPIISDDDQKFTCEPANTGEIAIITVFWLEGENGKQQMQTWMNEFANSEAGMVCTTNKTNPFWQ